MAIETHVDIIEGATATRDDDGLRVTRSFLIKGFRGTPDEMVAQALKLPNIPQHNEAHPSIPGIVVRNSDARCQANDPGIISIKVNYAKPDNTGNRKPEDDNKPRVEVGSTIQTVQTNLDYTGELILLKYNKRTIDDDGQETFELKEQTGTIEIPVAMPYVRYTRKEFQTPLDKSAAYSGKINLDFWNGFAPFTVQCLGITGQSDDDEQTFSVTYEFQIKIDGWPVVVAYQDPDNNNEIPSDVSFDNGGLQRVFGLTPVSFAPLGVDIQ